MKTIKRILCAALALTMLVAFAGCKETYETLSYYSYYDDVPGDSGNNDASSGGGSNGGTTSAETNTPKPTTVPAGSTNWSFPAELKGTTLKVLSYNPVTEIPGAQKVIDNFTKLSAIKVEWISASYDDYDKEIAAYIAGKNTPDIVYLNHFVLSRLQNLQPISVTGYDFSDTSVWDAKTMQAYSVNGVAYAMHLNPELTLFHQPQMFFYNTNTIAKYSLEDPYKLWKEGKWDMDKFIEICREFKKASGGAAWSPGSPWAYLNWMNLQGIFDFDGKTVTNNVTNTSVISALQQQASWRQEGLLGKYLDTDSLENGTGLFMEWNAGTARTSNSYFNQLKASSTLGVVPPPSIPGQSTYYTYMAEYEGYGILKNAQNAAAAPYFLRYFLDKNNYDTSTYFSNSHAVEVYEYLMKQERVMTYKYMTGINTGDSDAYSEALKETTPAQVATIANSYSPKIKAAADELNASIQKNFK